MSIFLILTVLLFITSSIAAFDIQFTHAKKIGILPLDEPDLPKWVTLIYVFILGLVFAMVFVDWRRSLIVFFVIFILSGFIPVLEVIGNVLMRPFRPKNLKNGNYRRKFL